MQCYADNLNAPITEIVHKDLEESLKRIEKITFQPDCIEIILMSSDVSVRGTIMMLDLVVEGSNYGYPFIGRFDMSEEYLTRLVRYDDKTRTVIIDIPGVTKMTFINSINEKCTFQKTKSDLE